MTASRNVTGKVDARISETGWPENEMPKSPRKMPPRKSRYCTMTG